MKHIGRQVTLRRAVGYVVLALFALIFIAPFIITVLTSFKTDTDATLNPLAPSPIPRRSRRGTRSSGSGARHR